MTAISVFLLCSIETTGAGAGDVIPHHKRQYRFTAATEASLIIGEEYRERAASAAADMTDDELRQRVVEIISENAAEQAQYYAHYGMEPPPDDRQPDPATLSREEMVEIIIDEARGAPPTLAIAEDEDDPIVEAARDLRHERWAQGVAAEIERRRLKGADAAEYTAAAEKAELAHLRQLVEETWSLPEAELRARALEIVSDLAGGDDCDKKFSIDPASLSRGYLLQAIACHIDWLTWSPDLRAMSAAA